MALRRLSLEPPPLSRRRASIRPDTGKIQLVIKKSSPSCRIAWLYLKQNKIQHEIVDVDDGSKEKQLELHTINVLDTVPCLVDGSTVVHDCPAILFYLAEKYTHFRAFGTTPSQRARAESIMCWASASLTRSVMNNFVHPKTGNEEKLDLEVMKELSAQGQTEVTQHVTTLEKHYLNKNTFLLGKEETFVDSYVAMILTSLDLVSFNFKPFPRVKNWLKQIKINCGENWEFVCETHNVQVMQRGSRRASLM